MAKKIRLRGYHKLSRSIYIMIIYIYNGVVGFASDDFETLEPIQSDTYDATLGLTHDATGETFHPDQSFD